MKVYNNDKTKILENYDLNNGKLIKDTITHNIPAIKGQEKKTKLQLIKEYPNGGKSYKEIVIQPYIKEEKAKIEYEDIYVYIPFTDKEKTNNKILELKKKLFDSDYKAIKFAEGQISEIEYEPIKQQRIEWRKEIDKLGG